MTVLDADAPASLATEVTKLLASPKERAAIALKVQAMALPGADEIIARKVAEIVNSKN